MKRIRSTSLHSFLAGHGIGNREISQLFATDTSVASRLIRGKAGWSVDRAIALVRMLNERGIDVTVETLFTEHADRSNDEAAA